MFNNKDSSEHIEKFLNKVLHNLSLSGADKSINSQLIIDCFFTKFFEYLDKDKNFYFIDNLNAGSLSFHKVVEPNNLIEIRYIINQTLTSQYTLKAYDMGNHNKISTVMDYLGSDISYKFKNSCFGDSYVVSEPVIRVFMDPMGNNTITFHLKFNVNPDIRKCNEMDHIITPI